MLRSFAIVLALLSTPLGVTAQTSNAPERDRAEMRQLVKDLGVSRRDMRACMKAARGDRTAAAIRGTDQRPMMREQLYVCLSKRDETLTRARFDAVFKARQR